MADYIPFEMQTEIMKMLPVKSLLQFRSVSKQWKSLIDSSKFIKKYHLDHPNPQHHLLVRYELNNVLMYTSIIDNNTFPQQKLPLTAPESLSLLRGAISLVSSSDNGLICYFGYHNHTGKGKTVMAVIWNPTIRKSVAIVIPTTLNMRIVVGFGVCPCTSSPKLVKISVVEKPSMWVVDVFTLSRRVWETVYMSAPFKSCHLLWTQVSIDGVIYWRAYDHVEMIDGVRSNFIISFDLKSDKFGEVCLPERLVYARHVSVANVNESLALLEHNDDERETSVCGVWMRKDGENKPFTKIYTVKVEGWWLCDSVLGFRKNGEVVLELEDDNSYEPEIKVYEPSSGRINSVGIIGEYATFDVWSYMEKLLLFDEPNTVIHS